MARPIEHDHTMCPECNHPTAYYDGYHGANMCTNRTCTFCEPVEKSKMMTKWDIIDMIQDDKDLQNAIWNVFESRFEALYEKTQKEHDTGG